MEGAPPPGSEPAWGQQPQQPPPPHPQQPQQPYPQLPGYPPAQPYPQQPGYGQYGYEQPPYPQQYQQQYQQPYQYPYPYYPQPSEPGNPPAIVALALGIASIAMLPMSAFFLWPLTLGCGIAAIFVGRSGMSKVDRGETPKHRGIAQAGFITGIVGTVLSLITLAGCVAFFAAADGDGSGTFDFETTSAARVAGAVLRAAALGS